MWEEGRSNRERRGENEGLDGSEIWEKFASLDLGDERPQNHSYSDQEMDGFSGDMSMNVNRLLRNFLHVGVNYIAKDMCSKCPP